MNRRSMLKNTLRGLAVGLGGMAGLKHVIAKDAPPLPPSNVEASRPIYVPFVDGPWWNNKVRVGVSRDGGTTWTIEDRK